MKIHNCVLLFMLATISVTASGQCAKPEMKPFWNSDKGQLQCVDPSKGKSSGENDFIQPTGDKSSCASSRDSLLAACPQTNEGKECRGKAKSIFNACYKRPKGQSENGGAQSSSETHTSTTDVASCMDTFNQQQQACSSRKIPSPSPGQLSTPDTCLQDALAAQRKCLANSH